MDRNDIILRLTSVIVLILSLTVHEWAHAYSAFLLGDTTAKEQGRLTLNPLAHIDPIGTILLPLLRAPFGWAKPVPFNPRRFRRSISMRTGTMITKAAGPMSNVALTLLCIVLLHVADRSNAVHSMNGALTVLLYRGVHLNAGLAVFNLIPIEPLDGAGVLDRFIPDALRTGWYQLQRIGPMLLMLFLFFGASSGVLLWPIQMLIGVLEAAVELVGI